MNFSRFRVWWPGVPHRGRWRVHARLLPRRARSRGVGNYGISEFLKLLLFASPSLPPQLASGESYPRDPFESIWSRLSRVAGCPLREFHFLKKSKNHKNKIAGNDEICWQYLGFGELNFCAQSALWLTKPLSECAFDQFNPVLQLLKRRQEGEAPTHTPDPMVSYCPDRQGHDVLNGQTPRGREWHTVVMVLKIYSAFRTIFSNEPEEKNFCVLRMPDLNWSHYRDCQVVGYDSNFKITIFFEILIMIFWFEITTLCVTASTDVFTRLPTLILMLHLHRPPRTCWRRTASGSGEFLIEFWHILRVVFFYTQFSRINSQK